MTVESAKKKRKHHVGGDQARADSESKRKTVEEENSPGWVA